jgi:transcriptional regulator with XRE-family HTH domain
MLIQRVLEEGPFSMRQLAEESGLSYDTVRAWAASRRTPREENLLQLAAALDQRGGNLRKLAAELRKEAK